MSRIEIAGDVVSTSPYKIRMINKVNDIETFRSDMTVDEKKKSFILNAFMDPGICSLPRMMELKGPKLGFFILDNILPPQPFLHFH